MATILKKQTRLRSSELEVADTMAENARKRIKTKPKGEKKQNSPLLPIPMPLIQDTVGAVQIPPITFSFSQPTPFPLVRFYLVAKSDHPVSVNEVTSWTSFNTVFPCVPGTDEFADNVLWADKSSAHTSVHRLFPPRPSNPFAGGFYPCLVPVSYPAGPPGFYYPQQVHDQAQ